MAALAPGGSESMKRRHQAAKAYRNAAAESGWRRQAEENQRETA
jgi:hypothetical protein